jgi:hypothetical protein
MTLDLFQSLEHVLVVSAGTGHGEVDTRRESRGTSLNTPGWPRFGASRAAFTSQGPVVSGDTRRSGSERVTARAPG